jgi:hypothetical protein
MGNRFDDWLNAMKLGEYVHKKDSSEQNGRQVIMCVLSMVGAIALIASIAYAVYKFMNRDYLDDFNDDFDDYEDEEEDAKAPETAAESNKEVDADSDTESAPEAE